jgi:hypothetical protein
LIFRETRGADGSSAEGTEAEYEEMQADTLSKLNEAYDEIKTMVLQSSSGGSSDILNIVCQLILNSESLAI